MEPRRGDSGPGAAGSGGCVTAHAREHRRARGGRGEVAMRDDGYRVEVKGIDRWPARRLTPCGRPLLDEAVLARVAAAMGERVFRVDVTPPGFGHLELGGGGSAEDFRRLLVRLGFALGAVYRARFDRPLLFTQLGRFDQQVSTEAHRDGAPDESVLLLGYEPTS